MTVSSCDGFLSVKGYQFKYWLLRFSIVCHRSGLQGTCRLCSWGLL